MRILHGPQNISGMAYSLARAQRRHGADAESVTAWSPIFHFESDRWLDANGESPRPVDPATFMKGEYLDYDVYHFYFGLGFADPDLSEFVKLKRLGKKVFMYFCGCDLRDSKAVLQRYKYSVCMDCWPQACSPNRSDAMEACRRHADGVFVSTVDLLDEWPDAAWLPQAVDIDEIQALVGDVSQKPLPKRFSKRRPLKIAHAPSDPSKKGTEYLVRAVDALKTAGLHIELAMISGVAHETAMRTCAESDIAVDQLIAGVYGSFGVEMMAIGKPLIAFMRDGWMARYPEVPPIISACPDTIEAVLADIYKGGFDLRAVSADGRAYALKYHDAVEVAGKALEYYGNDGTR